MSKDTTCTPPDVDSNVSSTTRPAHPKRSDATNRRQFLGRAGGATAAFFRARVELARGDDIRNNETE